MKKSLRAKAFAINAHRSTNHYYGDLPYEYHLQACVFVANQFSHAVPTKDFDEIVAAIWLHDVIEDCRVSYNDLKKTFGINIAEMVYAVTNEKGRTRDDRAGDRYLSGIRQTQYATFVKLCDRIANITHSKRIKKELFMKYRQEQEVMYNYLFDPRYRDMFDYIEKILYE